MCAAVLTAGTGGGGAEWAMGQPPTPHQWDLACPELLLVPSIQPGIQDAPMAPHCPADQVPFLQSTSKALGFGPCPPLQTQLWPLVHKFQNQADPVPQIQFMHLL